MRRVVITRGPSTDHGTHGALVVQESDFTCVTGELPDRDNAKDVSCIPLGHYVCELAPSARFKRDLYHVRGVPGREGVLIHQGNLSGDVAKGFVSQVEGCILLGDHLGLFKAGEHPAGARDQRGVCNSVATVAAFMEELEGQPFELVIQISVGGIPGGY